MKLGRILPYLRKIQKSQCLSSDDVSTFSPKISNFCYIEMKIKIVNVLSSFFLPFFLLQKFYIVFFIIVMYIFARNCRRWLSYHQALLYKYLHLKCNVFVIYDESKTAPQRPSMTKCPKNTQASDRGTPSPEEWCRQNCYCASLLKLHFGMVCPICPKTLLKRNTSVGLLLMHYNTLIFHVRNLHLMWHNPVAVFKNTLVYWHK